MKNKILLSVILLMSIFISCNGPSTEGKPIITVKYVDIHNPCICRYYYNGLGNRDQDFTDSCSKYDIGDTIK